jgi:hypothetical protein
MDKVLFPMNFLSNKKLGIETDRKMPKMRGWMWI